MTPYQRLAGCPGCNKQFLKVSALIIKLLGTIQLMALFSFCFHMSVQADDGVQMSKIHESCHKAMRDRHHFDPFHFPKHLRCKSILHTEKGLFIEKTAFVPPNRLEYTCRSFARNTSEKAQLSECQAMSNKTVPPSRAVEIPRSPYPIVLIKDDIYLHPEQTLSELITSVLYNGGNLAAALFHGMIYREIWQNYQLSNNAFAFRLTVLGVVWNSLAIYKHSLHAINTHSEHQFTIGETAFELISMPIKIDLEAPGVIKAFKLLPIIRGDYYLMKDFRDEINFMKESIFVGLIGLNCIVIATSWISYSIDNHYHEDCPTLASAPENAPCIKQIEEMHVLLDQ
ncbi:hypothetical protein [Endozoicomonas sp. ALC020]|uniref:hypothetical protein n=1 Tax=unclassified Endozoicomonas TaxID=2644528 RepID=UPI003BB08A74